MSNICAPLFHLGVTGFFYIRLFDNGTFIDLSVDPKWAEFYFKNFYSENYKPSEIFDSIYLSNNVSLWALNESNKIWQEGKEIFGHGNGLTLRFPGNEGFTEIFFYYSTIDNYKINEFYLSNLHIFKNFAKYFKEKAEKIINDAEKNRFIIPEFYKNIFYNKTNISTNQKSINDFYSHLTIKRFHVTKEQYLTYKEAQCLHWYAQGNTIAETGTALNISKRTVERHLDNLKQKSNCFNKAALTQLAIKLGIIDFFTQNQENI